MAALEEDLTRAAAKEAWHRKIGDYDNADYWRDEAENIQARITIRDRREQWTALADNRHG